MKEEMKMKPEKPIPEEIPKTTGSHNTSHSAYNIGGMTSGHVNPGGDSISGRTSDTGSQLQARQVAQSEQGGSMKENVHPKTDTPQRQGPGEFGSANQAEEYIDQYDQKATPPSEDSKGLTSSSSPGQSLHREKPPFPVRDEPDQKKSST